MTIFRTSLSLLCLLLVLIAPSLGAKTTATSFCKCICFNNSTIIALNPPPSTTSASTLHKLDIRSPDVLEAKNAADEDSDPAASRPHHKLSCADCTRAFCLDYNLPICKNAREEDVFTTCFQRDSLKDETVVVIFIFATAGLLVWAAVKPWIDRFRERNTFLPLRQHDHEQTRTGPFSRRASKAPASTNADDGASNSGGLVGGNSARGPGHGQGGVAGSIYDDDVHADQDAVDIVSDMSLPSGSGSGFHS